MPNEPAIRIHSSPRTRATRNGTPEPIDALFRLVDTLKMARKYEPGWFEAAEAKIHAQVAELERELTAEVLGAHALEAALRDAIVVPDDAVSVAVSIDGVLAPVNGGANPVAVRKAAAQKGTICKGPAGYREVGCATLTFCDASGEVISSIRTARAPEA